MKRCLFLVFSILSVLTLLGCSSSPNEAVVEAQTLPAVKKGNADSVIAEGIVTPARTGYLAFKIGGDVAQVHVREGDYVEAGTLLARLDTQRLELAMRSAEQDLLAQQAAMQQLLDGASDAVIARADKANADQLAQAEVLLEIKRLQLRKAQVEDPTLGVAAARARLRQLELALAQAQAQDPAPSVKTAEIAVERARIALTDTQDEYNKALDRPWEDQKVRDGWAKRLEQAQLDYRAAQAQLESAQNAQKAHQLGLNVLGAQIEEARVGVENALAAQAGYTITLQLLDAEVRAAELNVAALKANDNPYRDPPSAAAVAQLQALLDKAAIGIETLKLQLQDAELRAPFAGTVVEVSVEVGDTLSAGQVVVVLATLDRLEIRTKDLTELAVAQVAVGQAAQVTADALPGQVFAGRVSEIALRGQDYRGDVVYQVTVLLDQPEKASALRWGMTTMVEIKTSR